MDYFGVCVRNARELNNHERGFDVVVHRTDSFGFYSYSGFSGSPVLNEFGYAVGVVTDQLHNSLGYTSIHSIAESLKEAGVELQENADELDARPYGLGTCIRMAEKALMKMQSRYREGMHVEDENLENVMKCFCGLEFKQRKDELHEDFEAWYNGLPQEYKACCDKYQDFKTYIDSGSIRDNFYNELEYIAYEKDYRYKESALLKGKYMTDYQRLIDKLNHLLEMSDLDSKKFLYISGDAGNGKTHHLCDIVRRISRQTNIYLFFGHEFKATENPVFTIGSLMHWDSDYLDKLNQEMSNAKRYAIFVIDALNEGEGTYMWVEKLPQLMAELSEKEWLKLIVSVRTMDPDDVLIDTFNSSWVHYTVDGFRNLRQAIDKYFGKYGIRADLDKYASYQAFQKPLFLKIFCEAYYAMSYKEREEVDISSLYDMYFSKRNEEVSKFVDDDPRSFLTNKLMYRLGGLSLELHSCSDVPRKEAIKEANRLCPNRKWSQNLYHGALKANLLMEYSTSEDDFTMFGYDSLGDYVRSAYLLHTDKSDEDIFNAIIQLGNLHSEKNISQKHKKSIFNTIKAVLTEWNPDSSFWKRNEFKTGLLKMALIEGLSLRTLYSKKSTVTPQIVQEIIQSDDSLLDIKWVLKNITFFQSVLMPYLHERLMKMSMRERDEKWTIGVNGLLETYSFSYVVNEAIPTEDAQEHDWFVFLQILCWMMTSSHPLLRIRIIRKVSFFLNKRKDCCIKLINTFHSVNDPYVMSGVYSAIYGVLLRSFDKELTKQVAEKVYSHHYQGQKNVPREIMSRNWSLKILEYNHYLSPEDSYWEDAQPPYETLEDFMYYPENEQFTDCSYFGTGKGANRLYSSLFEWDFNRYIIGTNSMNVSDIFSKGGSPILMNDITKAVAYRIKHGYGYNSEVLSRYDETVDWDNNHYHRTERIGKKYQWIALEEVYAYLCDTCSMKKGGMSQEFDDVPYPWYCNRRSYLDPTLHETGNHITLDNNLFDTITQDDLFHKPGIEWIESREDMPPLHIVFEDRWKNSWVTLVGYQTMVQTVKKERRESFVFYSPCMVPNRDGLSDKFAEWAKKQNFYGRWMPEFSGNYEYLWNEAPWSDSFNQMESNKVSIWGKQAPCEVILPYNAQLQENRVAVDDEEYINSTVYMPIKDMYSMFDLHNAERGVVRNKKEDIIAINRRIPGDALDALVIRKDVLDRYLKEKDYSLFYCNPGEKLLRSGSELIQMQRLSSCCQYAPYNGMKVIQPMTDERDFLSTN